MRDYPKLVCPSPGPRARAIIARDARTMSQNYRKDYPLVVDHAIGPVVVDADGNRYLDFAAGIAVEATALPTAEPRGAARPRARPPLARPASTTDTASPCPQA